VVAAVVLGPSLVRRGGPVDQVAGRAGTAARAAVSPIATAVLPGEGASSPQAGSAASRSTAGNVPATIPVAPTPAPIVPTPAPTLPPLPPVLVDTFGDPNSGFPRQPGEQEQPAYWNVEYRIFVAQPDAFTIAELAGCNIAGAPGCTFGDLVLEADVRAVGPSAGGSYGFVFHRQDNGDSIDEYFVLIDPETGVVRVVHWSGANGAELLPPAPQPPVARGEAPNHLAITCKGTQVTVAINGAQVAQVNDNGPPTGVIGLRADAGAAPIEVRFDNVVIRPAR